MCIYCDRTIWTNLRVLRQIHLSKDSLLFHQQLAMKNEAQLFVQFEKPRVTVLSKNSLDHRLSVGKRRKEMIGIVSFQFFSCCSS